MALFGAHVTKGEHMNYAVAGSFSVIALAFAIVIGHDAGISFALGLILGVLAPFFIDLFLH